MSTRTEAEEGHTPTALREVWAWREAVYEETKGLSIHEAFGRILDRGRVIRERLGLPVASFPVLPGAPARTRERRAPADSEDAVS